MIQSSSFISLMTVLATNGDRGQPAGLKVSTYCWPAGPPNLLEPTGAVQWHPFFHIRLWLQVAVSLNVFYLWKNKGSCV